MGLMEELTQFGEFAISQRQENRILKIDHVHMHWDCVQDYRRRTAQFATSGSSTVVNAQIAFIGGCRIFVEGKWLPILPSPSFPPLSSLSSFPP
jgi:hypothetical protein